MSALRRPGASSFRRRLVVAPRRRARPVLRVLARLARIATVVLPVAAVAAWILASPAFSLRTLEVTGTQRVAAEWVEGTLQSDLGRNLVRLELEAIHARLEAHPWIRSVELRKRLPHHLSVEVVEHRAAALVERPDGGLVYVSDEGEVITAYDGGRAGSYLVIDDRSRFGERGESPSTDDGGSGQVVTAAPSRSAPKLRLALGLARRLEGEEVEWCRGLERIEILGEEDYRLRIGSLPFPVLVRADVTRRKARALDELLPRILANFEPPSAVDLRFSGRIVVKGAAHPPREGTG